MHYRDTPRDRYHRDPSFKQLVDMLEHLVHKHQFSPSELREAAVLASINYEAVTLRHRVIYQGDASRVVYVDIAGEASFSL